MKHLILLYLLIVSCVGTQLEVLSDETEHLPFSIATMTFEQDISNGLRLALTPHRNDVTARLMEHSLALIKAPKHNCFNDGDSVEKIALTIKNDPFAFTLTTKPKLEDNAIYGLYRYHKTKEQFCAAYVFQTRTKPRLIAHDLGEGPIKFVHPDRRRIRATFDRPIDLSSASIVEIVRVGEFEEKLKAPRLVLDVDLKTLWIFLKQGQNNFLPGSRYRIQFAKQFAADPLDVHVLLENAPSVDKGAMQIHKASSFADITWPLDREHLVELFIKDAHGEFQLWRGPGDADVSPSYYPSGGLSLLMTSLSEKTTYDILLRAEDAHGHVAVASTRFTTAELRDVVVSEVMVDPLATGRGEPEQREYIEIENRGRFAISLVHATLQMQDMATSRQSACPLNSAVILNPGDVALIVGRDFQHRAYGLREHDKIIRLEQKSLCQGLSNRSPKIIRLIERDGFLLAYYGGVLWPGKKGKAIARASATGLADAYNYCYSHPTPGKKNGPCG